MKKRNHRRNLIHGVVLGLAAAAVAVPTAQARHEGGVGVRPDSNASYYRALTLRSEGLNRAYRTEITPDDRAGVRGPGAPVATPTVVSTPTTGFDWTDAGVGAGGAVLVIVLLSGGLWIVARRTNGGRLAV